MQHGPKKQSTGNYGSKRDRHESPKPKGPGQSPGPTKGSYKPKKFRDKK